VNVVFACPHCERPGRADLTAPIDWQCPACAQRLHLEAPAPELSTCVVCGNHELYKKKDFPHWLGMTILVVACVLSVFTYFWYLPVWTWAILIGSAALDGLLYLWVGDAIVCYRCNAHYRGVAATDHYPPHDITIGERYRQERMRREQLKAGPPPR
jgi:hypothetical protein